MKKTFTTFLVFAALSLGIKAQTTTWSFENLPDGTITENTPINGLEINASKVWTVEPNTKTFGTDQYTKSRWRRSLPHLSCNRTGDNRNSSSIEQYQ